MILYGLDRVRPRNTFKNVFSDLSSVADVVAEDNRIDSVSK